MQVNMECVSQIDIKNEPNVNEIDIHDQKPERLFNFDDKSIINKDEADDSSLKEEPIFFAEDTVNSDLMDVKSLDEEYDQNLIRSSSEVRIGSNLVKNNASGKFSKENFIKHWDYDANQTQPLVNCGNFVFIQTNYSGGTEDHNEKLLLTEKKYKVNKTNKIYYDTKHYKKRM